MLRLRQIGPCEPHSALDLHDYFFKGSPSLNLVEKQPPFDADPTTHGQLSSKQRCVSCFGRLAVFGAGQENYSSHQSSEAFIVYWRMPTGSSPLCGSVRAAWVSLRYPKTGLRDRGACPSHDPCSLRHIVWVNAMTTGILCISVVPLRLAHS